MPPSRRNRLLVVADALLVIGCAWWCHSIFVKLFIDVPHVQEAIWHYPWRLPRIAATTIFAGTLAEVAIGVALLALRGPRLRLRIAQAAILVILIIVYLDWAFDFGGGSATFN